MCRWYLLARLIQITTQRHLNQLPIEGKVLNGQTVDTRKPFSRRKDSNGIDYLLPIKLENFSK